MEIAPPTHTLNTTLSSTRAFCLVWVFIGSSAIISIYLLMAWTSTEGHILIFYSNRFATKTKRLCFHYLPLAISIHCNVQYDSSCKCAVSKNWVEKFQENGSSIVTYICTLYMSAWFVIGLYCSLHWPVLCDCLNCK
jgi:hypothetical protein